MGVDMINVVPVFTIGTFIFVTIFAFVYIFFHILTKIIYKEEGKA